MSGAWRSLLLRQPIKAFSTAPPPPPHPWPEWSELTHSLHSAPSPILPQDAIDKDLPPHFLTSASALLSFARRNPQLLGMLSKTDIQVLVITSKPFLFRAAIPTVKKMTSFLALTTPNDIQEDKADTVDLVKYILSCASNPALPSLRTNIYSREIVESSVRNLLRELAVFTRETPSLDQPTQEKTPLPPEMAVLSSGSPSLGETVEERTSLPPGLAMSNGLTPSMDQPVEEQTPLPREWAVLSSGTPSLDEPVEEQTQFQDRYARTSRRDKRVIVKKLGDWVCPECSFMNFARNNQCLNCKEPKQSLECEESKQKGMMAREKWECPQCKFFNYERNMFCLSCDCKMPFPLPSNLVNSMSASRYDGGYKYHASTDPRPSQDVGCSHMSSTTDNDFPEIMPLRSGENRFVVSTRKTPLELCQTHISKDLASGPVGAGEINVDDLVNRILDKIMGPSSVDSQNGDKGITSGENAEAALLIPKDGPSEASSSISNSTEGSTFQSFDNLENLNNVNNKNKEQEAKSGRWFQRMAELRNVEDLSSAVSDEDFSEIMPVCKDENKSAVSKKMMSSLTSPNYRRNIFPLFQVNEKGQLRFNPRASLPKEDLNKADRNQVTSNPTNDETASENSQEKVKLKKSMSSSNDSVETAIVMDKSASSTISSPQKYSRRVLFPEDKATERLVKSSNMVSGMTPVCKGENKFKVSKKKTSSLTSPTYRRNMAAEQASSSEYVPYVSFSPGYVSRTEPQPPRGSISPANSADIVPTSPQVMQGYAGMDNIRINQDGAGAVKRIENDHIPSKSNIIDAHQEISSDRYASHTSHPQNSAQIFPKTDLWEDAYQFPDHARASHGEDSAAQNIAHSTILTGDSLHSPANCNMQSGWTGKSLEGSAVKGLDTFDMSEEAKAAMWLQRISQMMKISHR